MSSMIPPLSNQSARTRPVSVWLFFMAAAVLAMAVIGAITRLTESGLSIMEWAPLSGALPPLVQAEWERLFALYQQTDEFRVDNPNMDLAGFKTIFWWEWIHRQWGRMLGLFFVLPLVWFWLRGRLPGWIKPWLILALAMGGFQGFLGWFMVSSGFESGLTDVSHFRLAIHLSMAVAVYALLLALAFRLELPAPNSIVSGAVKAGLWIFAVLLGLLIITGAFVAGMNAGLVYNEWPTMGDGLVPFDYQLDGEGFWVSALNTPAALQFNHRWFAAIVASFGVVLGVTMFVRSRGLAKSAGVFLAAACGGQFLLGLIVLLLAVPVWAGALHQFGAFILVGVTTYALSITRN